MMEEFLFKIDFLLQQFAYIAIGFNAKAISNISNYDKRIEQITLPTCAWTSRQVRQLACNNVLQTKKEERHTRKNVVLRSISQVSFVHGFYSFTSIKFVLVTFKFVLIIILTRHLKTVNPTHN